MSRPSQRSTMNRQIVLAARPNGVPRESDFKLVNAPVPVLKTGEVLVRAMYLSIDPVLRTRMSDVKSYAAPFELGGLMGGGGIARVIESRCPSLSPGDVVAAATQWQEYAVLDGGRVQKIDPLPQPITAALGVLGGTGLTAYFGLLDICQPKPGETVVVSGAAGAVGTIVCQIAKIKGCRVAGIAGSDEKVNYILEECGCDAAFNYKTTTDYTAKLAELCPKGIDIYFDNTGGPITDAVFGLINVGARISICGQVSQYNNAKKEMGPRFLWELIFSRAKVQGFLTSDYAARFDEARAEMAGCAPASSKRGRISWKGLRISPRRSSDFWKEPISENVSSGFDRVGPDLEAALDPKVAWSSRVRAQISACDRRPLLSSEQHQGANR